MPHNVIIEDKNAPIADIGSVNVLVAADCEKYTPAKKSRAAVFYHISV